MSVAVGAGASLPVVGTRSAGVETATPQERQTDEACAAQDLAAETISTGLALQRRAPQPALDPAAGPLDRLLAAPGPLDRLMASDEVARDR